MSITENTFYTRTHSFDGAAHKQIGRWRDGHKGGVKGPLLMKQKEMRIYVAGERFFYLFIM